MHSFTPALLRAVVAFSSRMTSMLLLCLKRTCQGVAATLLPMRLTDNWQSAKLPDPQLLPSTGSDRDSSSMPGSGTLWTQLGACMRP